LLAVTNLGRHPTCVLARRDSDAGRELLTSPADQSIPLSRLTSWELIGPDRQSGLRRQLEQRLRNKPLYFVAEGGGWSAAKEYARQGLGVAIVPLAIVNTADSSSLVSRRLAAEFDVTDYLICRRDESRPFVAEVKKAIITAVRGRRSSAKKTRRIER
jgi:DNA-binding transcriptional LysR family regulator